MRSSLLLLCLLFCVPAFSQDPLPAIGEWREHLPYNSAIDLAPAADRMFAATPYSLFSVEFTDGSIERHSRVTGLSETGISSIFYDTLDKKLLIAYTNSNIDLLINNRIVNIPDIKRDNIIGDKTIYSVYRSGDIYYLSTGIAVVLVDAKRFELKDTWFIGTGGNQVKVNGFSSDGIYFYAATEEGLKKALVNAPNLADPLNWVLTSGNGISNGPCQQVLNLQGRMVLQKNDSLFIQSGNNWNLLYTDSWRFTNVQLTEKRISVCERNNAGLGRVIYLNADGSVFRTLASTGAVSFPRKAITRNDQPWVADQFAGLSYFNNGNNFVSYLPNSPQATGSGEMIIGASGLSASSGAVNSSWNYQYNGDGIFQFFEGRWKNTNRFKYPAMDSLLDIICLAEDKRDNSLWAGSFGGGLLHIKEGPNFEIFKQGKLGAPVGDPGSYRVAGLAFDSRQFLWISNFGSAQPLKLRKTDGSWKGFSPPFSLTENALSQILIDDNGFKWIVSPLGNGLLCYDEGADVDNTGDDRWRRFRSGTGNGNLPGTEVLCVNKDRNGLVWIGTNDGAAVIECADQAFSNNCDARWPVVPNGNFAGYLFKGQEVRSIVTDGANRKWMGTRNGLFLVDAAGEKLVYRFTEDNSPLLSNDISKLVLDGVSGELFIATSKGLCSFRSTATEPAEQSSDLLVFPNPVPAGYTGTIAIRGLAENSIVKITELNGRLVYQTRSLGGQAVWDGKNYNGQRIASGAYLILAGKEGGKETMAGKIFFIAQ